MQPRQRRETIEIGRSDTRHGNLDGFAACRTKAAEQAAHCAGRDAIAMRMGEHDARAGLTQALDGGFEGRPLDRCISGTAARQPALEDLADAARVSVRNERPREMHARGHGRRSEDLGCDSSSGQSGLALEPFAHLGDAVGASCTDLLEMGDERRIRFIEAESDDVQGLTVPAAGHFDTVDMLQPELGAGTAGGDTSGDRVVIGERRDAYASRGAQLDQRARLEHAVGVQAVQMKIGRKRDTHHRYDSPMSLSTAAAPRWDEIDTVLLDLDGTLLDLAFDNYIWLARVAEIYAENHGLSLAETHAALAPRFARVQGTLDWYCINYWTQELGIDIARVHREEAHRVAWLPGARGFLERVRARGKRLVLMTNSHPVILEIKQSRTGVLAYLDAAYTSHGFGAPKEDQRFWAAARAVEPFDPARTMFVDDSRAVLHAAVVAGIRWVYGVKRPDTSRDPHDHEEFAAIDGVAELG